MSSARRNLLIAFSVFWLLISWLVASLRPGADGLIIFMETLQIFIPGLLLLVLIFSFDIMKAEKHTAVLRKDFFGGTEVFINKHFLYIPFFFKIVARMPVYPLRFETIIERIDTRTARLTTLDTARVRCDYKIVNYKTCLAQSGYAVELLKELEERHKLKPTDAALWPMLLDQILGQVVDDKLRDTIWEWQQLVENDDALRVDPLSVYLPRQQLPDRLPDPPPAQQLSPNIVMENDPYDLSLNRLKVAKYLLEVIGSETRDWGITFTEIVIEQVVVNPELITRRTRNKESEITEAQHKGLLDAIAVRARGIAEANVRAHTVRRILEELSQVEQLPTLSEETITAIVRAAMYSDGEMIWKGVLEKSSLPPATDKTAKLTEAKTA